MVGIFSLLIGCIPYGALGKLEWDTSTPVLDTAEPSTEPSTEPATEPSGEPSTEETDTEDTNDTQDTDEPLEPFMDMGLSDEVDHEYGRSLTTGWHAVMDGSFVLGTTIPSNGITAGILDFKKPWGVGMTVAPFNSDVFEYMFGNTTTGVSSELPLFEARNRVVSIHFPLADAVTNLGLNCSVAVEPTLIVRRLKEGSEICSGQQVIQTGTPLCIAPGPAYTDDMVDLQVNGFQIFVISTPVTGSPNHHVKAFLDTPGLRTPRVLLDQDLTSMEEAPCAPTNTTDTRNTAEDVQFLIGKGHQLTLENDSNLAIDLYNLNARIDNIVLFELLPEISTSLSANTLSDFWISTDGINNGTTIYHQTDILPNNPNKDGFVWWNFEQPRNEDLTLIEASVFPGLLPDQSPNRMSDAPELHFRQTPDLSSDVPSPDQYFRNFNDHLLDSALGNWYCATSMDLDTSVCTQ